MKKDPTPPQEAEEHFQAGMKEIAQRVGVSKTTVHRALTGSGRISQATRDKILAVAQELDYTPNILARSLRRQRTGTIGVITNAVSNSYYGEVLSGIEEAAGSQGFNILFCCSSGSSELESNHINVLREKRVDGLIIAPALPHGMTDHFTRLRRADTPFVFIDRMVPSVSADVVMTDHRMAGQMVAEHLIAGGRKKIGIIAPLLDEHLSTSVQERIAGIEDIAKNHKGVSVVRIGRESGWEPWEEFGAFCLADFLDQGGDVDAVVGLNDNAALGALYTCQKRGIAVPGQLAIAGYDDLDISSYVNPRLTTVRQPIRQLAWEAVKLLLSRMGGNKLDEAVTLRLRPTLMERESTPKVEHSLEPVEMQ